MCRKTILGVVVMVVVVTGPIVLTRSLPAADRLSAKEQGKDDKAQKDAKQNAIAVDVVIEEVDLAANTVTAASTLYVIPPHDNVGGMVFITGTTGSHKDKATRYVRLPVMPQAQLAEKKPKVGQRVILRLEPLRRGLDVALVVVGIEAFTGLERIGVDSLDAPAAKAGK